jgi:hypothetical protein
MSELKCGNGKKKEEMISRKKFPFFVFFFYTLDRVPFDHERGCPCASAYICKGRVVFWATMKDESLSIQRCPPAADGGQKEEEEL